MKGIIQRDNLVFFGDRSLPCARIIFSEPSIDSVPLLVKNVRARPLISASASPVVPETRCKTDSTCGSARAACSRITFTMRGWFWPSALTPIPAMKSR